MKIAAQRLSEGEIVHLKVHGQSMRPYITSGSTVILNPRAPVVPGVFALVKVKGRFYVHVVKRVDQGRYLIANAAGRENGWTRQLYGVVVDIKTEDELRKIAEKEKSKSDNVRTK